MKSAILTILLCFLGSLSFFSQAIEHILPLQNGYWLTSSKSTGLSIVDDTFSPVSNVSGHFIYADTLVVNNKLSYVLAVGKAGHTLHLFELADKQLTPISTFSQLQQSVVAACLYMPSNDNMLQAIVLAEGKQAEQRLLLNTSKGEVFDKSIRYLPIAGELSACAVDNKGQLIYIAEEDLGLWRVNAEVEGDINKQAIQVKKPSGHVESPFEFFSLADPNTILLSSGKGKLVTLKPNASQPNTPQDNVKYLPLQHDAEFIAAYRKDKNTISALTLLNGKPEIVDLAIDQKIEQDAASTAGASNKFSSVTPFAETTPVNNVGDAADDPAIWVNTQSPQESLIIGTDKSSGLGVYSLSGELQQFLPTGRMNNVDIAQHFGKDLADSLVVASNRDLNSISLYLKPADTPLEHLGEVNTSLVNTYGICMHRLNTKDAYVFINDKNGKYLQYQLSLDNREFASKLIGEFQLPDQPEGCVVDPDTGTLYVGVEDAGVWKTDFNEKGQYSLEQIISIGGALKDDVEGLAIYKTDEHSLLVVSSQGNDSYALYKLNDNYRYAGSLKVHANYQKGIDGASETDGLAVSSANFGGNLSEGILVVQDGRNVMPSEPQNFKVIAFEDVLNALNIPF